MDTACDFPERFRDRSRHDRLPRSGRYLHRGGAVHPARLRVEHRPALRRSSRRARRRPAGSADLAFVPIENSIEGTVNAIVDSLVFEVDLLIQREVVLDIHMHLMAPPGSAITVDNTRSCRFPMPAASAAASWPTASPRPRWWPPTPRPRRPGSSARTADLDTAALAPRLAAELYGLDILASAVEDHPDNQTRFVALAPRGIPAPTGHDKTSIVCFQREDRPGSLHAILSEFAARSINLTKLESRPTKRGLGDYCFLIDSRGHVADEVVADCLRVLHAELAGVKFLGSYPAAGEHGPAAREQADTAWREADDWIASLRRQIADT